MKTSRIEERVGRVQVRGGAHLQGHRIVFNKRSSDGTGKANIAARKGSDVWGVIFGLTHQQFDTLASFERGYRVHDVPVHAGSHSPQAKVFIADETGGQLGPSREYLGYLIDGAREHGLPDNYVKLLEAVKVSRKL